MAVFCSFARLIRVQEIGFPCNPSLMTIRKAIPVNIHSPRQLRLLCLIVLADVRVFRPASLLFPKPTHASVIKYSTLSADSKSNAGIVNALAASKIGTVNSHISLSTRLQMDGRHLRRVRERRMSKGKLDQTQQAIPSVCGAGGRSYHRSTGNAIRGWGSGIPTGRPQIGSGTGNNTSWLQRCPLTCVAIVTLSYFQDDLIMA